MCKDRLIERLEAAHPGWNVYDQLLHSVRSREFQYVESDELGNFITNSNLIVFADIDPSQKWPDWLPGYVPALYGMNAAEWELAGGYAGLFCGELAEAGFVFSPIGDEVSGFPVIDVPQDTYAFQSSSSGAQFFLNRGLEVLYPHSETLRFEVLDEIAQFTQNCIVQTLHGEEWYNAYCEKVDGTLMD